MVTRVFVALEFSRFAGAYPSTCRQKGGPFSPLLRRGIVSPNAVPAKKGKGVRARHGL